MNQWVNSRIFGFDHAVCAGQGTTQGGSQSSEWVAGKSVLRKTRSRIMVLMCAFFLAYAAIVGRMTHLTLTHEIIELAEADVPKPVPAVDVVNVRRGDILDRDGRLLATSLKTASLYADPKYIQDVPEAARKLVSVFPNLNYDDILQKMSGKRRFVWIKRNLTPKQIYAANRLGIPGVDFLDETRRVYPYGPLASHVVGYADVDGKGLSGMERAMDGVLTKHEESLQTTIDVRMQHILNREVKQAIDDFTAIGGAGMVMDAKTGEIYAMTSLPDFNPHEPGRITDAQRFNRITLGSYEMGSTFKIFTMAAGLEYMNIPLSTHFETTAPLRRAGFTIRDYHPERHPMAMPEIFMRSSNIGTALIAEKVGTPNMRKLYEELGFFAKPSIEIKETAAPILPRPWRDISTVTASYGHGIAVTPLHLAAATAAIVNGGYKVKPTLIKRSADSYANEEKQRIISEATSATMRNLLRIVVTDGTARKANAQGYLVGGKTGTAEKTLGRGYSHNAQIASFVGAFPMDNPRFVVLIMVDEPKGNKKSYGFATAGWVAAPYIGNVIRDIAPLANVMPKYDERLPHVKAALGLGSFLTAPQRAALVSTSPSSQGGRLASY